MKHRSLEDLIDAAINWLVYFGVVGGMLIALLIYGLVKLIGALWNWQ